MFCYNEFEAFSLNLAESMTLSVEQEYLKEVGGLSSEALRMIGDLLNEQSLMYTALTELIYDEADINDNVT